MLTTESSTSGTTKRTETLLSLSWIKFYKLMIWLWCHCKGRQRASSTLSWLGWSRRRNLCFRKCYKFSMREQRKLTVISRSSWRGTWSSLHVGIVASHLGLKKRGFRVCWGSQASSLCWKICLRRRLKKLRNRGSLVSRRNRVSRLLAWSPRLQLHLSPLP